MVPKTVHTKQKIFYIHGIGECVNVKETINKFHPNCKNIVLSSPTVRTDKKEANNILKNYNNILKLEKRNVIFHNNISASHLHRDDLHLNLSGAIFDQGYVRFDKIWIPTKK